MKPTKPYHYWIPAISLLSQLLLPSGAVAQGTAFTYQGRLTDGGQPAGGQYDLEFRIYDAVMGGIQQGATVSTNGIVVADGLFTAVLDFGSSVFTGATPWLELSVRTNGAASFTVLTPRQTITAAPYAIFAGTAVSATTANTATSATTADTAATAGAVSGSISVGQLTGVLPLNQLPESVVVNGAAGLNLGGTFAGNGLALTNLNGANISPASITRNSLSTDVRAGVGTIVAGRHLVPLAFPDPSPIEIAPLLANDSLLYGFAPGGTKLVIEDITNPTQPKPMGGFDLGDVRPIGPAVLSPSAGVLFVVEGPANAIHVLDVHDPAAPFERSIIHLDGSLMWGGGAAAHGSFLYTGNFFTNAVQVYDCSDPANSVRVASLPIAAGPVAIAVQGSYLYVGDWQDMKLHVYDLTSPAQPVELEPVNMMGNSVNIASNDKFLFLAFEGQAVVQAFDISDPAHPRDLGGAPAEGPVGQMAVMGNNLVINSGVFEGNRLEVYEFDSTGIRHVGYGPDNARQNGQPLLAAWGGVLFTRFQFTRLDAFTLDGAVPQLQFSPSLRLAAKSFDGDGGLLTGLHAENLVGVLPDSILPDNIRNAGAAALAATSANTPLTIVKRDPTGAFSAGAVNATTVTAGAFVGDGSGLSNLNIPPQPLPGNVALRDQENVFSAKQSVSQGGLDVTGALSLHGNSPTGVPGSSLWISGNDNGPLFPAGAPELGIRIFNNSTAPGQSTIQGWDYSVDQPRDIVINDAGGRVGIGTSSPSAPLEVNGEAKATVFTATSDRNAKENFSPVDVRSILEKVAALPISEWTYKKFTGVRHIGPVAQDFHATFGLGNDDKGIATVDADGVALAAIQGLNQKLADKDTEIQRLQAENQSLAGRLEAIERALGLKPAARNEH